MKKFFDREEASVTYFVGRKEELAELIQDDDGMYEILKSTSAGEQLAEHMKAKEGKKIANKILSAAPVRLS